MYLPSVPVLWGACVTLIPLVGQSVRGAQGESFNTSVLSCLSSSPADAEKVEGLRSLPALQTPPCVVGRRSVSLLCLSLM